MKKSIFFVALVATALTFVSCGSKTEKQYKPYFPQTGWEEYDLKGKVKELHYTISSARIVDGEIQDKCVRDSSVIYFNEDGQVEKHTFKDGLTSFIYTYSGDTCIVKSHKKSNGNQFGMEEPDKVTIFQIIINDKRGNRTSYSSFYGDNEAAHHREYKYDEQGLMTEMKDYNYGRLSERHKYLEHNKYGLYHKQLVYKENGDLDYIIIVDGNDMEHITNKVFLDKDGNYLSKTTNEYNKYGFLTKINRKGKNEKIIETTEYTYKYDQFGNYVEKTQTNTSSIYINIEERTIVYY